MKLYNDIADFHVDTPIITIGSFDGVHLGHHKIIDCLNAVAQQQNGESVIMTFSPHPRLVLYPEENNLQLLTTCEEKTQLLKKAGIDHLIFYPFTKEFAQKDYADFVRDILVNLLKVKVLVVGHDHRLGKNRKGNFELLQELSVKYNFILEKLDALSVDQKTISSTTIRNALKEGNIEKANRYLGYPFNIHGIVVKGAGLGRKIQFPTANIEIDNPLKIIPAQGVYAVRAFVNGQSFPGMLNIGIKPTVNIDPRHMNMEVHLLDFSEDIYHQPITVEFIKKLRDEIRFSSIDELKEQLTKDEQTVRGIL